MLIPKVLQKDWRSWRLLHIPAGVQVDVSSHDKLSQAYHHKLVITSQYPHVPMTKGDHVMQTCSERDLVVLANAANALLICTCYSEDRWSCAAHLSKETS